MQQRIDLNADLGEGGAHDAALMALVSSANIACGGHAGTVESMREAVRLALANDVAIGAHPSFADRENFGRSEAQLSADAVVALVLEQCRMLQQICEAEGARLHHVKPHGALYNQSARDPELAAAIVRAVAQLGDDIQIYGLAGGALLDAVAAAGLTPVSEVFADRRYTSSGSLQPRGEAGAVMQAADAVEAQVLEMLNRGGVTSASGEWVTLQADTLCLHGDNPRALELARRLRSLIEREGIVIQAP